MKAKLKFEPVRFDRDALVLIDQRELPGHFVTVRLKTIERIWQSIREMVVRGAPAIGIAAGYGLYLGIAGSRQKSRDQFLKELERASDFLKTARPTAVNLSWAVERICDRVNHSRLGKVPQLKALVLEEAKRIHEEDIKLCFAIGKHGVNLIRSGDSILTHCNAGGLATSGYGTALSPLFEAKRKGIKFSVFVDETRPLLQGARLTMWELRQYGIQATLICDNVAGSLMQQGKISKVVTGADRIVRNGDTANKIGTYSVACLAKMHGIPFYVAAPNSTFDFSRRKGSEIPIEERDPKEITGVFKREIAPKKSKTYNPAFDVTPHELITAFITEKGILKPPFEKSFSKLG